MYTSSSDSEGEEVRRDRRGESSGGPAGGPSLAAMEAAPPGASLAPTDQTGLAGAGLTAPGEPAGAEAWPRELLDLFGTLGLRRQQLRPLLLVTGCTGLGSQSRMWKITGLKFREIAAAEPKEHAKAFLKANRLFAECHFDDLRALIEGGQAECACHGRMCDVPAETVSYTHLRAHET